MSVIFMLAIIFFGICGFLSVLIGLWCVYKTLYEKFGNPGYRHLNRWLLQHFGEEGRKRWLHNQKLLKEFNSDNIQIKQRRLAQDPNAYMLPIRTANGGVQGMVRPFVPDDYQPWGIDENSYEDAHASANRYHEVSYITGQCHHAEPYGTDWLAAGFWDKGIEVLKMDLRMSVNASNGDQKFLDEGGHLYDPTPYPRFPFLIGDDEAWKMICAEVENGYREHKLSYKKDYVASPVVDPAKTLPFKYKVVGNEVTITGYIGPVGKAVIPTAIKGLPVTQIGNNAFLDNSRIVEMGIPNSVTCIGNGAFKDCANLDKVVIPDSVTYVGKAAFEGCVGMREIILGKGMTSISDDMLKSCHNLKGIKIPVGITSIGSRALFDCFECFHGLHNDLVIPEGVTRIDDSAFAYAHLGKVCFPSTLTWIGNLVFDHTENCGGVELYFNGDAPRYNEEYQSVFKNCNNGLFKIFCLNGTKGWKEVETDNDGDEFGGRRKTFCGHPIEMMAGT
jgi:hypothetical protein